MDLVENELIRRVKELSDFRLAADRLANKLALSYYTERKHHAEIKNLKRTVVGLVQDATTLKSIIRAQATLLNFYDSDTTYSSSIRNAIKEARHTLSEARTVYGSLLNVGVNL